MKILTKQKPERKGAGSSQYFLLLKYRYRVLSKGLGVHPGKPRVAGAPTRPQEKERDFPAWWRLLHALLIASRENIQGGVLRLVAILSREGALPSREKRTVLGRRGALWKSRSGH